MSQNWAPPEMIVMDVMFDEGGNTREVILTAKDFIGESFEAHKSLCSDASFHLGGCVSEWIKFTTSKLTYLGSDDNEHPIPWDKACIEVYIATAPIQPGDTYNYVRGLGMYFGQTYNEKVNHSQVEVTAYDWMYLLNNYDVTDWYNNYAGTYPTGRNIDTFWGDFCGWLPSNLALKYDYPDYPIMNFAPALMSVYTYKERLMWQPTPTIDSGGSVIPVDLFSGVVTAGMIIKGVAAAFGCNAYLYYPDRLSSRVTPYLCFFEMGDYAQESVSLLPTDYFNFEYSSFDTTPYTNVRMAVFESLWKANNNEGMTYGFSNNWVFNSMSNVEIIDDPVIGDDDKPLQSVAQLLLARLNNVNSGAFRPMSVVTDKFFEIGQQIVITGTDGNTYNSIIMQRDYTGIYGKRITYTCIGTEDYFREGDIGGENAVSGALSDLSGKVPIEGGTSGSVASWNIKPSGIDVKKSGSSVIKVDSNGLSLDAVSIKKNGVELPTAADVSDKVSKSGDTMTGGLNISAPTSDQGYNEGLRLNRNSANFATLCIGTANGSTKGITDGAFWLGVHTQSTDLRKLWITHCGSTDGNTYFGADSASQRSPYLNLGVSGSIASGDTKAVNGNTVFSALANYWAVAGANGRSLLKSNDASHTYVYLRTSDDALHTSIGYYGGVGTFLGNESNFAAKRFIGVDASGLFEILGDIDGTKTRFIKNTAANGNVGALQSTNTTGADCNNITGNFIGYYTSNGPSTGAPTYFESADGILIQQEHNDLWKTQLAQDYRSGRIAVRSKNNGTWQAWKQIPFSSEVPSLANYVPIAGGVNMTGVLAITSANANYAEGLRINQGNGGYVTLLLGGAANSTTGTNDGAFWIGTNPTVSQFARKLYIAHNGSTDSSTYFGADNSSQKSPYLNLGSSGTLSNGSTRAITGGQAYKQIRSGYAQLSAGSNTINFGNAMEGAPKVVAGLAGTQNAYARVTASTSSGFTVYASAACDINWVAVHTY